MSEQNQSRRTNLEWVTCPYCSTTFRVAVSLQYKSFEILTKRPQAEQNPFINRAQNPLIKRAPPPFQQVVCVSKECHKHFFLLLHEYDAVDRPFRL